MSDLLAALRWRDLFDIALVSLIIYRVLLIFRGTRAVQMLAGLGILIAGTLFARRLELPSLTWLFDNLWSFWVIALVVLFQPELRRALGQAGQGRVVQRLLGASRHELEHIVDEVADAVASLAPRRIGALIVLERGTGLRPYAELGVALDALVSADLLLSVFPPASPLHDGAVLVQGTRIVAAGCFLPLSRNREVGRSLGTRHRAALGVSEEVDAVAVVVSEETGHISMAVQGRLESIPDADVLRVRLAEVLIGSPPAGMSAAQARQAPPFIHRSGDRG
ncbi:MAG: TIGR00159 family protein [Candidatus Rokubacteria bacterium]|nr:TIGR00159 family protein [Candidatus Rokubacteria bacterium]